ERLLRTTRNFAGPQRPSRRSPAALLPTEPGVASGSLHAKVRGGAPASTGNVVGVERRLPYAQGPHQASAVPSRATRLRYGRTTFEGCPSRITGRSFRTEHGAGGNA